MTNSLRRLMAKPTTLVPHRYPTLTSMMNIPLQVAVPSSFLSLSSNYNSFAQLALGGLGPLEKQHVVLHIKLVAVYKGSGHLKDFGN